VGWVDLTQDREKVSLLNTAINLRVHKLWLRNVKDVEEDGHVTL
jgi:hypothetical protein